MILEDQMVCPQEEDSKGVAKVSYSVQWCNGDTQGKGGAREGIRELRYL